MLSYERQRDQPRRPPCGRPMLLCTQPSYSGGSTQINTRTEDGRCSTSRARAPGDICRLMSPPHIASYIATYIATSVRPMMGLDSTSALAVSRARAAAATSSELDVVRPFVVGLVARVALLPMRNWAVSAIGVAGMPWARMTRWVLLQRGLQRASARSSTHLCACFKTKQLVQRSGHGMGPSRGGVVRMPAPSPPDPIARGALPSRLASNAMLGQPRGSSSTCR
jgi:hypothetical protein